MKKPSRKKQPPKKPAVRKKSAKSLQVVPPKANPITTHSSRGLGKLATFPLEAYKMRYTEMLHDWEVASFSKRFDVCSIRPQADTDIIHSGSVLDSVGRGTWSLRQVLTYLEIPELWNNRLFFSDFFTPGIEAIAYSDKKHYAAAFLWAQTFDQYDFTVPMINWMRPYECMAFEFYDDVFVASSLLKELIVTVLPHVIDKVHVVGLPFDSTYVSNKWDSSQLPAETYDCVYTSRWDREKNAGVFMDLVLRHPEKKFAVCTGWDTLRGTDIEAIRRAEQMPKNLTLFKGLDKARYYSVLSRSRVQFNCLSGDTLILTKEGAKPIKKLVGYCDLMTEHGRWLKSHISSFGKQKLYSLTFGRGSNSSFKVRATLNHRWYLANGRVVTTKELRYGDVMAQTAVQPEIMSETEYLRGVQHGIVFGDGSKKSDGSFVVRLCRHKKELLRFFEEYSSSYPPSCNGDPVVYLKKSKMWCDLKKLPKKYVPEYLLGFFRGWLATDGSINSSHHNYSLSGTPAYMRWAREHCAIVGWHPAGISHSTPVKTRYGLNTTDCLTFYSDSICEADLLLKSRAHKISKYPQRSRSYIFKSLKADKVEEVFCAQVPETHNFALWNGMLTGNCAFQDWVSFTLLEALTYGCRPLYPDHRSFPEALMHDKRHLYIPFDKDDIDNKFLSLIEDHKQKRSFDLASEVLHYHNNTLSRITERMYRQ